MKRSKFPVLAAALLWLLLCVPTAAAAEWGSLKVRGVTQTVRLYQILDPAGSPTAAFSGAGELLEAVKTAPVAAARKLAEYAAKNHEAAEKTPDQTGAVFFGDLPLGMYLVCSTGGEFAPFLLEIPTELNGKTVYNIEAKPKQEETPPEETVPPTTQPPAATEPGDPAIPQTGVSVIPKYTLMCLGTVLTLWGLCDMLLGKEDTP